jgi:hypothetical protein
MKRLLVISNHAPDKWDNDQKKDWSEIQYFPFPNVDPHKGNREIITGEVATICAEIGRFYSACDEDGNEGYVTLQGEFTVCKGVFDALHDDDVHFVFPTTERKVVEKDGIKTSVFEFVQWR